MRKVALLSALLTAVPLLAPADAAVVQGFVYSAGTFTFINLPGPPTGINDAGQIVGSSYPSLADSNFRGFLYDSGTITTISPPGAAGSSGAFGINDAGQIVGSFFDANHI